MEKPELTNEQKKAAERKIKAIRDDAPTELKDIWLGEVTWEDNWDIPRLHNEVLRKLTPKLGARYLKVVAEVENRTIKSPTELYHADHCPERTSE